MSLGESFVEYVTCGMYKQHIIEVKEFGEQVFF